MHIRGSRLACLIGLIPLTLATGGCSSNAGGSAFDGDDGGASENEASLPSQSDDGSSPVFTQDASQPEAGSDGCASGACDDAQSSRVCGDSTIETGEQCDDGNAVPGDGCSGVCQIEPGYTCP